MKLLKLIILLLVIQNGYSQEEASVEKSIFGIQTGFLGAWLHNESKLSNQISLRSEIGLDFGFNDNGYTQTSVLIPSIRVEPRWYYNLEKRVKKGRKIANNSGNFLALNITYNPDWFYISNQENLNVISTLAFLPKWGIKRTVGNHFTYETGIGIGTFIVLEDYKPDSNVALDLHLRVGYTF